MFALFLTSLTKQPDYFDLENCSQSQNASNSHMLRKLRLSGFSVLHHQLTVSPYPRSTKIFFWENIAKNEKPEQGAQNQFPYVAVKDVYAITRAEALKFNQLIENLCGSNTALVWVPSTQISSFNVNFIFSADIINIY